MEKPQRLKYEMFVRVRNFGIDNRDVFPESAPSGRRFADLTALVTSIEHQLVRREQARAEARKVKLATWRAVIDDMKAIASTGREVAEDAPGVHPFRLPQRRAATSVFTTARLFLEEARRRAEQFVDLGMPPTFLADFAARVEALERAVGVQQDSRGARREAQAGVDAALARGAKLIRQLDVTVANVLRRDPGRLGQWRGARRIDGIRSSRFTTSTASEAPSTETRMSGSAEKVLRIAS